MNGSISIYMKDAGDLVSFQDAEKIAVFEKRGADWKQIYAFSVALDRDCGLSSLRLRIREMIGKLGDCRIIAGLGLSGVIFTEFDKSGFYIFDITDYGSEILDSILSDIEDDTQNAKRKEEIIRNARPVETSVPGIYYMDLIALQAECPEISSKQAMRDFIENTPFVELRLICKHIPPWLENSGLDMCSGKNAEGNFSVVISGRYCKGG